MERQIHALQMFVYQVSQMFTNLLTWESSTDFSNATLTFDLGILLASMLCIYTVHLHKVCH